MNRKGDNRPGPHFSDGRALILLLVAAIFLYLSFSCHPPSGRGAARVSLVPARDSDRALLRLVAFGKLDLNRAGYLDLVRVPGIGPARARAIMALREERGRIERLDELTAIRGIGPKTVAGLARYLKCEV